MLSFCTAPFLCIFVALIGLKICRIFEGRKIKKLEEEMRARGMNEDLVFMATKFMKL